MKIILSPVGFRRLWVMATTVGLVCLCGAPLSRGASAARATLPRIAPSDPWTAVDLIEPATLAGILAHGPQDARPLVLCVGFPFLYHGGHIPGAILAGPASRSSGLAQLKHEVQNLPHGRHIVIYCGCCPWKDCPNVRPAFRTLNGMGFTHVRVLVIPHNFEKDWAKQGYPVKKGG